MLKGLKKGCNCKLCPLAPQDFLPWGIGLTTCCCMRGSRLPLKYFSTSMVPFIVVIIELFCGHICMSKEQSHDPFRLTVTLDLSNSSWNMSEVELKLTMEAFTCCSNAARCVRACVRAHGRGALDKIHLQNHTHAHICTYTYTCTHMCTHMYIHMHTHMYIHMHTHTHQ